MQQRFTLILHEGSCDGQELAIHTATTWVDGGVSISQELVAKLQAKNLIQIHGATCGTLREEPSGFQFDLLWPTGPVM